MGVTCLLDTHAFVWAVSHPDRLGTQARKLVTEPTNTLLVSAATAWELATKVRLGEFPEAESLVAQYDQLVMRLAASHLAISHIHSLRAGGLGWQHRDPFDRMLAAQAMLENCRLITRDQVFSDLGGLVTAW